MLVIRIARAGSRHVKHTWITFPNDRAICRQLLKIVIVTCTMSDSCYWTALNATWLVVISHFLCTCHRSNELIILNTKCSEAYRFVTSVSGADPGGWGIYPPSNNLKSYRFVTSVNCHCQWCRYQGDGGYIPRPYLAVLTLKLLNS